MKYRSVIFVFFFLIAQKSDLFSQIEVADTAVAFECSSYLDTNLNQQVYLFADKKAEFPGGERAMIQFIQSNLKYPSDGFCVAGTVFVEFVLDPEGKIVRKAIRRPVHKTIDVEALRVTDKLPRFIPAECDGK